MKKNCPDCNIGMVEVNDALDYRGELLRNLYPKEEQESYCGRTYREYRFFCKKCKREWLYFSRPSQRWLEKIPKDSQFRYSEQKKILVLQQKWQKYCEDKLGYIPQS